jgi:hypothetical protein
MATRYYIVGFLLILLGIVGFFAAESIAGVLDVTSPLNAIHMAAGAMTIGAATRGLGTMRAWGKLLGFSFAILAVAGFTLDGATVNDLLPLTDNNAWLHLVFALVFLYHALLAPPTL